MREPSDQSRRRPKIIASAFASTLVIGIAISSGAMAGETEVKALLRAMTDYVSAQKVISFGYDVTLEVVTKDHQKLALASSGKVNLSRPDKIRAMRSGGFADIEMVFDGQTLTSAGQEYECLYTG